MRTMIKNGINNFNIERFYLAMKLMGGNKW
jgi:hypothetical protein